ncbi:MAG: hypothetical protein M1826_007636 [Phylliscum demangeonii]|nr:MAG: hypothetical protein M1826_007636 [Phylliscum demangeonii]
MSGDVDQIPETVFKAVSGLLAGLAIIAAVVRTAYRLRSQRRLFVDDLFLLLACIFLAAATIVLYTTMTDLYLSYSSWTLLLAADPDGAVKRGVRYLRRFFAYASMTWTAIYAVKLSFLFFFRVLVDRIRYMIMYWRVVLGATLVAGGLCVCESAIECPHFDAESLHCAFGSGMNRTVTVTSIAIVVDFVTDLMIIALPIHLLWKVRMKPRQKLGLGVFLCLSVFMMITAVVRISALHRAVVVLGVPMTAVDFTWNLFWLQTEACVAVLMVSLTALRSIFVSDHDRAPGHARPQMSPAAASSRHRFWPSRKQYTSSYEGNSGADADADSDAAPLPAIPAATISGLRSVVRRGRTTDGITKSIALHSEVYMDETSVTSELALVPVSVAVAMAVAVAVPVPVPGCTVSPRRHEHGGEEV